jgi:hypothetical protein
MRERTWYPARAGFLFPMRQIDRQRARRSERSSERRAIQRVGEARETEVAHANFAGHFGECREMHAIVGAQAIAFGELTRLATQV